MVDHLEQLVVRDGDEGVDLLAEVRDPLVGLGRAPLPLEREGPGHDADGQRAESPGDPSHHGSTARPRTATLTGGDEHHVGALESVLDVLGVVLGRLPTLVRVGTGAEAAGQVPADVELDVRVAHQQRLGVGVDRDELDPPQALLDHPVDRVDSASADADDLDDGQVVL